MTESFTIKLNSGSNSILKIGFLFRAIFILIFVLGSALLGLNIIEDSLIGALICFAICFVLFLVFYNILNAAFFSESLIVTKQTVTVIHKNLGNTKKSLINFNEIKYFGFADQQYTKHTMDNPILDITGLATQERELQYIIDEGTIQIETSSKTLKFGKNMPSWEVEEVIEEIEQFTGLRFKTPIPQRFEEESAREFDSEAEEELPTDQETESSATFLKKQTYEGDFGSLTIEQKLDIPSAEDRAFLNGKLAASGKYQIGHKQFVLISNGFIYAIRGFPEQL